MNKLTFGFMIIAIMSFSIGLAGTLDVANAQPLSAIPAIAKDLGASVHLAQYSSGNNRELCLQDCRDAYGEWSGTGWNNYAYASCVQSCEGRFWRDFDKSMRNLEREGKEMG